LKVMADLDLLSKAFSTFEEASRTLQGTYHELEEQVRFLRNEVEDTNVRLRRSLAETEEARAFLDGLVQGIPVGVVVFGHDGRIRHHNSAARRMLGRDLSGANVLDLPFDAGTPGEVELERSGGGTLPCLTATATLGANGSLLVLQDLTRIKELEAEAEKNRRLAAMGELVAKIAHEIRNPLGSMELYATMLARDLEGTEQGSMAEGIGRGIRHLVNTLNNMLLYTRNRSLSAVSVDVAPVIDDVVDFLRGLGGVDIRVLADYGHARGTVNGDPDLIRQALTNLGMNAIQAMPAGGTLRISTDSPGGDYLRIRVADTGVGMDDRVVEHAFEPFFSTKDRGNGLGLSIVAWVMREHNGVVRVESTPGEGTVFSLLFPVHNAAAGCPDSGSDLDGNESERRVNPRPRGTRNTVGDVSAHRRRVPNDETNDKGGA